ncbi:MAG: septum formation inhibitor Maf [Flavobacteriaceae bacterium]|nr:septum formation inhibitor Maf [Flavobacteriales bacterium]MDP4665610.1 septum formation inhibitor Maf [Flavobacteriaceae bacterium]
MTQVFRQVSILFFLAILSCASSEPKLVDEAVQLDFNGYWNQGKAEITTYKLSQARYGELREGTAVSVFVTEPWNEDKMVKSDRGGDYAVMKLNLTKNFVTGIYPYSMMTSAFTPIDAENGDIQKVTCTSQEWCGQSFDQFNRWADGGFELSSYSYFESEGDEIEYIEEVLLEDEIWNRIRLNPEALPQGEIEMLPSTMYLRLSHLEPEALRAVASISNNGRLMNYSVQYPDIQRSISINFKSSFPYTIESWEEVYRDGFGANARELKTTASLLSREMIDYWNKNSNADRYLRKELGLE